MLRIDIRFREEEIKKMPKGTLALLEQELVKKLGAQWSDVNVRVRKSTSQALDISGVKDDEKKRVLERIEEVWEDDSWLHV